MKNICGKAARGATRGGGKFAIISISEAGNASYFCTHSASQIGPEWRDVDLQEWLATRYQPSASDLTQEAAAKPLQTAASAAQPSHDPKACTVPAPVTVPQSSETSVTTPASAAHKIKGLGRLKSRLAQTGIMTVQQLANADDTVLQAVMATAPNKEGFVNAVKYAREIVHQFCLLSKPSNS